MSHNAAGSSQTLSSREVGGSEADDDNCSLLSRCVGLVSQYRLGSKSKSDSIFGIQEILASSPASSEDADRKAFAIYLDMLDQVDIERAEARTRGGTIDTRESSPDEPANPSQDERDKRELGVRSRQKERVQREAEREDSDDDEGPETKKWRPAVDEALFPWRSSSQVI
jgi:hypothetical protein